MPIDYEVLKNGQFVYAVASGELTSEDLVGYDKALAVNHGIKDGFKELFDASRITRNDITKETVNQLVESNLQKSKDRVSGSKCAIVVSGDLSFHLAKYFESQAADLDLTTIVFNDLSTARIWLGISKASA